MKLCMQQDVRRGNNHETPFGYLDHTYLFDQRTANKQSSYNRAGAAVDWQG